MLEHRKADVVLMLKGRDNKPLSKRRVRIRQTRHRFLFGCNIFRLGGWDTADQNDRYASRFAALWNYATLPFYWRSYEPQEGCLETDKRRQMAEWCRDHSIVPKGHPLCWHETLPQWIPARGSRELWELLQRRIEREVTTFKGLIPIWDVVNEVCVMPGYQRDQNPVGRLCRRMGRVALVRGLFEKARLVNPGACLILNDYDVSDRYVRVIERCLEAGVKIDAIGIQSHMHTGWWGVDRLLKVCDRFARFGLPLHFTEMTILSGALKTDHDWHSFHPGWDSTADGEARQAREVESTYRTLFGHRDVQAVTWWDFSDAKSWQGAPAGLLRKDLSPKPAYEVLVDLVHREWKTDLGEQVTDEQGCIRFTGFLGEYTAEGEGMGGATFCLSKSGPLTVSLTMLPSDERRD